MNAKKRNANETIRVDRYLFDADPDPAFYFKADPDPYPALRFNADPDPALHFNADPDPALLQIDGNLRPLVYRPSRAPF